LADARVSKEQGLIDLFRKFFRIRKERSTPPVTPIPPVGSSVVRDEFKIKLMEPCRPEVWVWLMQTGWRLSPVRNDRRSYTVLHQNSLHYLNRAEEDKRQAILEHFLAGKPAPTNLRKR